MQVKSSLRFDLAPIIMVKSKKKLTKNTDKTWGNVVFTYFWWNCKLMQPLWKTV